MSSIVHPRARLQLSHPLEPSQVPVETDDIEIDQTIPVDQPGFCFSRKTHRQAERAGRTGAQKASKPKRAFRRHPATSDAIHSSNESLFLQGVEAFKAKAGTRFPTHCELLRVAESLGWHRPDACHFHLDS